MGNIFRKINKKNSKNLNKYNSLDFFQKSSNISQKKVGELSIIEKNDTYLEFSNTTYWCTKKYKVIQKYQKDGSRKSFFSITDSKPYLRKRFIVIRPNLARNNSRNKNLFKVLKKKNLYYLKKPFEELILYIAPISLNVLMRCVHTGERLYIRSAIEFYLQKYHIPFKRYEDNSKLRVRKHRKKLK